MNIAAYLKKQGLKPADFHQQRPVWKGPEVDGVTQSMLGKFLSCRERFRLIVVDGLKPKDHFRHRIEYGQMWHCCEEGGPDWHPNLRLFSEKLCKRYPMQQSEVLHWYNVCRTQFPIYCDYWGRSKSTAKRTPLLREQVFNVPYKLPSGRIVKLRGKWDGVDLVSEKKGQWIELNEHKTKGDIDETQLKRQLQFDLQTMLYVVALIEYQDSSFWNRSNKQWRKLPVRGVYYNVVRRPLSGGKGTITKHKEKRPKKGKYVPAETDEHFYQRLGQYIRDEPQFYFMRWNVGISSRDIERFKREFLNPVLGQLCDWWDVVSPKGKGFIMPDPFVSGSPHWRHPFGVYNPLDDAGSSELDEYLATGNEVGLQRVNKLFEELE